MKLETKHRLKLEERLNAMVNKTYTYMTFAHKILSYKIFDYSVTIVTNRSWLDFQINKIDYELNSFVEIDEPKDDPNNLPVKLLDKSFIESIKSILYENIENLRNNPEANIKKAKAINDQIKTMLDIEKTLISFMKIK